MSDLSYKRERKGNEKDGRKSQRTHRLWFRLFECCKWNSLIKALIIHGRWSLALPFYVQGNSNGYCFSLNRRLLHFNKSSLGFDTTMQLHELLEKTVNVSSREIDLRHLASWLLHPSTPPFIGPSSPFKWEWLHAHLPPKEGSATGIIISSASGERREEPSCGFSLKWHICSAISAK